jgi:site-specific DNA-cytosine methylase
MKVLSLFDGMSCGQIALSELGIEVNRYYASEIKPHAIEVTQRNFPNTIQLGSVEFINGSNLPKIDLLIGGSPCQSFSSAGDGTGFDGKSGLFWEYVRLKNELNPKWFLLENVVMKKEWQNIISASLGVEPIKIKSNMFGAQNRVRLYWTNIPIKDIEDNGLCIDDIVLYEELVEPKYWLKAKNTYLLWKKVDFSNVPKLAAIDVYNKKVKMDRRVPTLTLPHHNSLRLWQNGRIRKFTPLECERLQNVPEGYTDGVSDTHRYELLGDGWDVAVIKHIFKGLWN